MTVALRRPQHWDDRLGYEVIQPLKERIIAETGYGLQLEGASASALVKASKAGAK